MPEVQNVGAADYAQYQPSQYQYDEYAEDYNTQPAIYDEENAEIKAASKNHKGATALGVIIAAGLGLVAGRVWGKKAAGKELDQLKDAASKYKEFAEKNAKELEDEADKIINEKFGGFQYGKDFAKKVKEELGKLKKAFEETKESGEKVAEDTKKAAEDTSKKAE